jgi:hypothetical protein
MEANDAAKKAGSAERGGQSTGKLIQELIELPNCNGADGGGGAVAAVRSCRRRCLPLAISAAHSGKLDDCSKI